MLGLYKWKREVAVITKVNNITDLVDDEPKGKSCKERQKPKWIKIWDKKGAFNNIALDLFLHDEEEFCHFMHMSCEQFIESTEIIASIVSKMDTVMRKVICPEQRLVLTLRFLATGESFHSLEYRFRITRKVFFYIIDEVCKAIVTVLAGTCLKFPSC